MTYDALDADRIETFKEIAAGKGDYPDNAIDYLWQEVNPVMAAREPARKAALLSLLSHRDKGGTRGRLHTLLVGPPGTGKSEILRWVKHNLPNSYGVGPKSSDAGLKGDASGEELDAGALELAHGGHLMIEELDKFAKNERDALYESMSEGEFDVNQGNIRRTVRAECRVIAAANSTDPFKPAFRDRFDFVVEVPEYDAEETAQVTDALADNFRSSFIDSEVSSRDPLLRDYLRWIDPFEPGASGDFWQYEDVIRKYLISYCDLSGGIRSKTSWLRIAYSIAKANRRDMHPRDYLRAAVVSTEHSPDESLDSSDVEKLEELVGTPPDELETVASALF